MRDRLPQSRQTWKNGIVNNGNECFNIKMIKKEDPGAKKLFVSAWKKHFP